MVLDYVPVRRVLNGAPQFEQGNPNQFCFVLHDLGHPVSVAPFSVAWRVEIACDERYPGCEYVR